MRKKILHEEVEDWNKNARFYDEELDMPYQQLVQGWISQAYRIQEGLKVLDVGSGVQRGGKESVLIDLSFEMMKKTKRKNPSSKGVVGCAQVLPFKGRSFDIVICNGVLHHLKVQKSLRAGLADFHRVLKPDGMLCVFDRAPGLIPLLLFYLRKPGKLLMKPRSTCSTRNEVLFLASDIQKITSQGFLLIRRKYVVNILFQHMIIFTNVFRYLKMKGLAVKIQKNTKGLAKMTERLLARRALCAEQCLVFQKQ